MTKNTEAVKKNVEEIVTEEEFEILLREKSSPTAYCGYEVSGPVHVGTLVAVSKQMDFAEAGFEVKVLLADVHTRLNRKGKEDWIKRMVSYWRECFIGFGLTNAEFVVGSDFQFNREYVHDVLKLGANSTLNRALRSMQEVARDVENASVSQVIYPLMQVADIKALGVDVAHGGMEQRKIHMLAREMLPAIGYKKPVCVHTPLLCSLQGPGVKMSSSMPETMIAVDDEPDLIRKKIQGAYCPPEAQGNPILELCRLVLFPRLGGLSVSRDRKFGGDVIYEMYDSLVSDYVGKKLHPLDLKNTVSERLVELLEPVRKHLSKKRLSCHPKE